MEECQRQTCEEGKLSPPTGGWKKKESDYWNWTIGGAGTHVGDDADNGAHEDGEQVPSLSGDTSRGRDQPDQEAREDGVPEGLQLRALPFGSRSSLHRRDSGRCARADDALGERALRHGGRLLTLTKRKGRGTFTLEELRRARSRRVGAQARGGNGARPGGRCFRISGRDARCDGRRSHMSHHDGHLGGREREYSVGQACREEVDA